MPSLILEVGVSEASDQLRSEAHWWHAFSGGKVKTVVLIHANYMDPWIVELEVWTEASNSLAGPSTRGSPRTGHVLECTQRIRFEDGVVHGAPLVLDFETLMRRPPANSNEGDIVLDSRQISWICTRCHT